MGIDLAPDPQTSYAKIQLQRASIASRPAAPGQVGDAAAASASRPRPWAGWMAGFLRSLHTFIRRARDVGEQPSRYRRARMTVAQGAGGDAAPFSDVSRLMQASASYEDAFGMIRRRAAASFTDCAGALYVMQEAGVKMEMKAAWGKDAGCGDSFKAVDCRVMRSGEAQLASSDMACAQREQSLRAPSLCMPIRAQGVVLGVLMLQEGGAAGSLAASRPVVADLSDNIALALANMRLRDRLHALSGHDPLPAENNSGSVPAVHKSQRLAPAPGGNRKRA